VDDDIVARLRLRPTILRKNRFGDMETDRAATALFDDCHAIMREAADEIERLRDELNKTHAHYAHLLMQFVCEANAARRSTAPTPANTGGGADHQIPEAL